MAIFLASRQDFVQVDSICYIVLALLMILALPRSLWPLVAMLHHLFGEYHSCLHSIA